MDFSQEELVEAVERLVAGLLERAGIAAPPVDALTLAEEHLGIPVNVVEPVEEDPIGCRRPRVRRPGNGITLTADMSTEQRQRVAADGIGRALVPDVLRKVGVPFGTESKQLATHIRALVAARVLIPTRFLRAALREYKYEVPALHQRFRTASMEAVGWRLLDLDSPCVITLVDDGVVSARKSNGLPVSRKLESAEQECVSRIMALDLPHRAQSGEWIACGWPVPNHPFHRILLRAVRSDV